MGSSADVAQLAVEQERAIHATVGEHDLGELEQLLRGLVGGVLQEAVARAFDPFPSPVLERPWALYSSRRTWSAALPASWTT